jgi:hypothetical protein
MSNQRAPCVIHFVSDGKPWSVLLFEYVPDGPNAIPASTLEMLGGQVRLRRPPGTTTCTKWPSET